MTHKPTYEELEKRVRLLEQEKQDRIRAEQALRQSESSFSQMFESAPVPMAYASDTGGYHATTWNAAWYRTFGYSRQEADGRSGNDIGLWVSPQDRTRLVALANQQNHVEDFETLLRRKDGAIRNCSLFGRFIEKDQNRLLIVVYLDITQRKAADLELRRLRNSLSSIIDSMPSVLIGVDANHLITQWNQKAVQITGITAEKAHGQPLDKVFPRMAPRIAVISQSIASREIRQELRIPVEVNGSTRYEDLTIYPLTGCDIEGAVIRLDDVTEKVHLERMMLQNEKMLSLGGLAAGMAHEINNPLAGMVQTAAVMANRLGGRTDIKANVAAAKASGVTLDSIKTYMETRGIFSMLEAIGATGIRMAEIVENMLSFARKGDAHVSSHHPADLLDRTLILAQTDYDLKRKFDFKSIDIVREYEPDLPMIPCHAPRIQQVLLNVLRNGAQAMQETQKASTKPQFIFRLARKLGTGMLRIEIQDNGPGMDQETLKRVFEPFFTTKPVGLGTGLGLSVSYFIVTQDHGGRMSVESAPGLGARFIIELPLERTNHPAP